MSSGMISGGVGGHKRNHTRYSTFIDNENYDAAERTGNGSNKAPNSAARNKEAPTEKRYQKRMSSSSLHASYALPPLPDVTTPTDIEKSRAGAAASQHPARSRFGALLIRLGTSCCPCFSPGRVIASTPTGGSVDWLWAFGRRILLAVSSSRARGAPEDSSLIQRTASEEEILSKRPRFVKRNSDKSKEGVVEESDTTVLSEC